ncbi:MinD/ParA family protein [Paenibacillus protaetiae]|uniref:MinD/ParA family protein n=2 Tax=Paenibacillus protaetiae TaxID=2509456 RepID=A0A4P6EYY0_9BACL|nr:MinD/ParA family protein [Paenibacillus protaetiae]QAY68332.1 MinD/ParA family protein [Paenibacillus protaetiae]
MSDQAEALRKLIRGRVSQEQQRAETRLITVTSGKGGVGKSNFSLNFALALQSLGQKTLVFDADVGMANIDVLMGISSSHTFYDLLSRKKTIEEVIQEGPGGIHFIAGGSGIADLLELKPEQLRYAAEQVASLQDRYDVILFDTGAGLSREAVKFMESSQDTIVVTTPEPTSITDAYALLKLVHSLQIETRFKLVVNRALDHKEGSHTADKIIYAADRFLQLKLEKLGILPDDPSVSKSVRRQSPFMIAFPGSPAARAMEQLARYYLELPNNTRGSGGIRGFIHKMFSPPR